MTNTPDDPTPNPPNSTTPADPTPNPTNSATSADPTPTPTNGANPAEPAPDHADAAPTHHETGGFAPGHRWRWKPGQSGNPGGRPRRPNPTILSDILRDGLTQPSPRVPGKNYAEVIGTLILNAAAGGNVKAINALLDRTEGRPRRIIENTGPRPLPPEEWAKLEAALAALEPYPDARNAALRAIIEYSDCAQSDQSPDRLSDRVDPFQDQILGGPDGNDQNT